MRLCFHNVGNSRDLHLWSFLLSNFKASTVYVFGVPCSNAGFETTFVTTLEAVPGPLVVCSPQNSQEVPGLTSVKDFIHPENACYVYGSNHKTLSHKYIGNAEVFDTIYVPTDTIHDMHAQVAAGIIEYDRRLKLG